MTQREGENQWSSDSNRTDDSHANASDAPVASDVVAACDAMLDGILGKSNPQTRDCPQTSKDSVLTPEMANGNNPQERPDLTGQTIGPFEFLEKIGQGQFGVVYRAHNHTLNRFEAIKIPLRAFEPDSAAGKRFRQEAIAAAKLSHPAIVQIFGAGELPNGIPFIQMEFCSGKSMAKWLAERPDKGVRPELVAKLVAIIAGAVHYAHHASGGCVVHRDLKPENVLLESRADVSRDEDHSLAVDIGWEHPVVPRICDFGLSKVQSPDDAHELSAYAAGTRVYMAPEQRAGISQPSVDIYALGVILVELLTGNRPTAGLSENASDESDTRWAPEALLEKSRVTRDLQAICLKCLAMEPAERYVSAQALAADLRRFNDGMPVAARVQGPVGALRFFLRRHWVSSLLALSVVLAMAASLSFLLTPRRHLVGAGDAAALSNASLPPPATFEYTPQPHWTFEAPLVSESFDGPQFRADCIGIVRNWGQYGRDSLDVERQVLECYIDQEPLTSESSLRTDNFEVGFKFGRPSIVKTGQLRDEAVVGDWTGDGYEELGIVRREAETLRWLLDVNRDRESEFSFHYGTTASFPVVGNFDRSGVSDIGVVEVEGQQLVWRIHTRAELYPNDESTLQPTHELRFGQPTDMPFVGDFDGDGRDDIVVVHKGATGTWDWSFHFARSQPWPTSLQALLSVDKVVSFGDVNSQESLVGDWDGDGRTDIGMVARATARPPDPFLFPGKPDFDHCYNRWSLKTKLDQPPEITFNYGFENDQFIAGRFNRPPRIQLSGDAIGPSPVDDSVERTVRWRVTDVDEADSVWRPGAFKGIVKASLWQSPSATARQELEVAEGEFRIPRGHAGEYSLQFNYKERAFPWTSKKVSFVIEPELLRKSSSSSANATGTNAGDTRR